MGGGMRTLIEKLELEKDLWDEVYIACDLDGQEIRVMIDDAINDCIDIVKQHQAESDWISVDERLPDSDCYVIVYCDGGNVTKSFFTTNREYLRLSRNSRYTRKAYGKNSGYFAISHDDGYKVTHWQPLPQPPSEVKP